VLTGLRGREHFLLRWRTALTSLNGWREFFKLITKWVAHMNESKRASVQGGRKSAATVRAWLDGGGRDQVQAALRKAKQQTQERNKARELDPDFLDRRVTF
jgi:hypothetical protein